MIKKLALGILLAAPFIAHFASTMTPAQHQVVAATAPAPVPDAMPAPAPVVAAAPPQAPLLNMPVLAPGEPMATTEPMVNVQPAMAAAAPTAATQNRPASSLTVPNPAEEKIAAY